MLNKAQLSCLKLSLCSCYLQPLPSLVMCKSLPPVNTSCCHHVGLSHCLLHLDPVAHGFQCSLEPCLPDFSPSHPTLGLAIWVTVGRKTLASVMQTEALYTLAPWRLASWSAGSPHPVPCYEEAQAATWRGHLDENQETLNGNPRDLLANG